MRSWIKNLLGENLLQAQELLDSPRQLKKWLSILIVVEGNYAFIKPDDIVESFLHGCQCSGVRVQKKYPGYIYQGMKKAQLPSWAWDLLYDIDTFPRTEGGKILAKDILELIERKEK